LVTANRLPAEAALRTSPGLVVGVSADAGAAAVTVQVEAARADPPETGDRTRRVARGRATGRLRRSPTTPAWSSTRTP